MIDLRQFIYEQKKKLDEFQDFWNKKVNEHPDVFFPKQDREGWDESFNDYKDDCIEV